MSEIEHMDQVDQAPGVNAPTEADEAEILKGLYGPPDDSGIYRGVEA